MRGNSQVYWWGVHQWIAPFLDRVGAWPMVGTAAWNTLADDDPAKFAALYDAAQHWALRVETCQDAMADASRAVSAAADWKAVANRLANQSNDYIPRVKETV